MEAWVPKVEAAASGRGASWCPGLGSNLTLTKHHSAAPHGAKGQVLMASLALGRGPLGKHESWASIGD